MDLHIQVDEKLYNKLKKEADYYNMDIEDWLELHLEEQYG